MLSLQSVFYCLLALVTSTTAISVQYCASENTGSGHDTGSFVYQSLGSCSQKCSPNFFSYAIVQGDGCWCSNQEPSMESRAALSACDQACPGYPLHNCGSTAAGLFGYVLIERGGPTSTATGYVTGPTTSQVYESTSYGVNVTSSGFAITSSMAAAATNGASGTGIIIPGPSGSNASSTSAVPEPYTGDASQSNPFTRTVIVGGGILSYTLGLFI